MRCKRVVAQVAVAKDGKPRLIGRHARVSHKCAVSQHGDRFRLWLRRLAGENKRRAQVLASRHGRTRFKGQVGLFNDVLIRTSRMRPPQVLDPNGVWREVRLA